jgi:hypothetical protein
MSLKGEFDELATKGKLKNIRDLYKSIRVFKKGYQLRMNIIKIEIGDLVTDCHSILATWRKHFYKLFIVQEFNVVRQRQIRTAEPLVHEPSAFEFEMGIEKLKRHK